MVAVTCIAIVLAGWSTEARATPAPDAPPNADADAPPPGDTTPAENDEAAGDSEAEDVEPAPEAVEPAPEADDPDDGQPAPAPEDPEDSEPGDAIDDGPDEGDAPIRPPRFDGPYFGVLAMGTANFANVLKHDTPSPLFGAGGFVQAGDAVFPWMSIGIAAGGQAAWVGNQQMFEGALLVEFGFVPINRYPFSIRAGFGFGGGALSETGVEGRSGYGGALFKGAFRYEFFPLADNKRPDRGGGWAIGPELGWLGATPSGKGQPFVNTILLGVSTSFYFGS